MITRIEALVDAIAHLKGSTTNPDGELFQIRNPIGIMSFSKPGKNEIDISGRRVFKTWLAGYRASVFDCEIKIKGESRAGLKKDDNLSNLLRVYGLTEKLAHQQVVKFLRRALKDSTITPDTPLAYFRGE
jgi:hypothetical protein